ncbi:cytochrome b [Idiomarina ramblicola]|uniref:Cytochrome b n=1 Tax=Idiomarina ramblicola TaxID=263724 RepID=A0A432YSZ5_9GAMM|nr:cytochrome b [Idiomarina ramblicola]RUO64768.1 cytochrome b [Idiomarina ramblicola]
MLRNTQTGYGFITIVIHWLTALIVIGLFALGWWMLTLTYYDEWYRLGPWWHKSFGIVLLIVTILRVAWTLLNTKPKPLGSKFERIGAKAGHLLLYLLLFTVMISGFLISTADGSSISVFDWFSVPAVITNLPEQADIAGEVHWYSALALVILAGGHTLAALKHHFINKDSTLIRMFGKTKRK